MFELLKKVFSDAGSEEQIGTPRAQVSSNIDPIAYQAKKSSIPKSKPKQDPVEKPVEELQLQAEMEWAVTRGDITRLDILIKRAQEIYTGKSIWTSVDRPGLLNMVLEKTDFSEDVVWHLADLLLKSINDPVKLIETLTGSLLSRLAIFAAGIADDINILVMCLQKLNDSENILTAALAFAAVKGKKETVEFLLKKTSPDKCVPNSNVPDQTILQFVRRQRNKTNDACIRLLTASSEAVKEELLIAIHAGNEKMVLELLGDSLDVNLVEKGVTPLGVAVMAKQDKLVKLLLDRGAQVDALTLDSGQNQTTPFCYAINNRLDGYVTMMTPKSHQAMGFVAGEVTKGDWEGVKYYLDHGFTELNTLLKGVVMALSHAIDPEMIKKIRQIVAQLLANYKAEVDTEVLTEGHNGSAFELACERGNAECIRLLLPYSLKTRVAMFAAVEDGNVEKVNQILSYGFDLDTTDVHGNTLLQQAAKYGQVAVAECLLAAGANPDAKVKSVRSALEWARHVRHKECIKLLTQKSEQALKEFFAAAEKNNAAQVLELVDQGIDLKKAILQALNENKINCITCFLACRLLGSDDSILEDKTALDIAREKKHAELIKLLTPTSYNAVQELQDAIKNKNQEQVEQLLAEGVNLDAKWEKFGQKSLFDKVVEEKDTVVIKLLAPYSKQLETDLFANASNQAQFQVLLDRGADQKKLMTRALSEGRRQVVQALLLCQFNPDAPFESEKSALEVARESNNKEMLKILIAKSAASLQQLKDNFAAENFTAVEKLLDEGLDPQNISKENRALLNRNKHSFGGPIAMDFTSETHPHLAKVIKEESESQNAAWKIAGSISEHSLIIDLNNEIELLRKTKSADQDAQAARDYFISSLEMLRDDLSKRMNKQCNVFNEASRTVRITKYTLNMLAKLRTEPDTQRKLDYLEEYTKDCKRTSRRSKFLRILKIVGLGAAGFIVGFCAGLAIGAITGPGAFVTAGIGGVAGASAIIGGGTALSAMGLSTYFMFFKPRGLRKKAGVVAEASRAFVNTGK